MVSVPALDVIWCDRRDRRSLYSGEIVVVVDGNLSCETPDNNRGRKHDTYKCRSE